MNPRISDSPLLDPVFTDRWSPRSFSPEPVSEDHLAAVFEAARWAPSWMNLQPWAFLYETDGPDRGVFEEMLKPFNRLWAVNAPVIGLIVTQATPDGPTGVAAAFDTGAATMSLTIQATKLGLSVHLLGGIERDVAHEATGIDPSQASIVCAFVMGHRGDGSDLDDYNRNRERPSDRRPASEFAVRGLNPPEPVQRDAPGADSRGSS